MGLNHSCEINFMIPGHTTFSPDRFFGLIKTKYRHMNVSSLIEIAEVKTSTTGGNNKVYVIGNEDEQSRKSFSLLQLGRISVFILPDDTTNNFLPSLPI